MPPSRANSDGLSPLCFAVSGGQQLSLFRRRTMKTLQQISMAVVLSLMLITSAFAGIMETGRADDPPPNPPSAPAPGPVSATATGAGEQQTSENPLESVALNLLQTMLSVF
jgi:hypothetical protein